jgi:NRAMP (natural resistance-associated macrophage protein)-like metal ion transporter
MDPGNWATDIAGGSRFGYTLLFVIMASNLMAILLQSLSLKLGVATERDLAQLCRESYGPRVSFALWGWREIAIAACDLAEVIGSAIALKLLFHIPLFYGVLITGLDVLLILLLQRWGFRYVEALVITLIGTIMGCSACRCFCRGRSTGRRCTIFHSLALHRHQPRHALHRHRNSGRDGDAAQSLPALVDCAEPQI